MPSALYDGQVMHQRFGDVPYRFKYRVLGLKIDIDRFEEEVRPLRWLSLNRFNLIQVNTADFGARNGQAWREWINELLKQYAINTPPNRVELVCIPRVLGMAFNPLAVWYAFDANNRLIAIIGEVSNTFGQWHHYVLANQGQPLDEQAHTIQSCAEKRFHVSPFIGMNSHYEFRFATPGEHYRLGIKQFEDGAPRLLATQSGKQQPLKDSLLLKAFLRFPFHALKVLGLIHWWALKIWLRGGKFHRTPEHLNDIQHSHSEMTLCSK